MLRASVLCALVLFLGCATGLEPSEVPHKRPPKVAPPPIVKPPAPDAGASDAVVAVATPDARPAFDPNKGIEFKEVSEKKWLADKREKLSQQLKIDSAELRFSPAQQQVAFVRGPPVAAGKKKAPKRPARYQIEVVDLEGKRRALFRPVVARGSTEPPKDFHFLGEDRVVYEVLLPPPTPAELKRRLLAQQKARTKARRGAGAAKPSKEPPRVVTGPPPPPQRLFIIQPVARRARPIRCQGVYFAFTSQQEHLAFVGGQPDAAFVSVDGVQVYPRRGRSVIPAGPSWSKDGRALAFLEVPATAAARLVLLAEFDNATGDTTWDLPTTAALDSARVFWAGTGKLVVGKTQMRPIFAASFEREAAPPPHDRSP